jgi:hypothetical protein
LAPPNPRSRQQVVACLSFCVSLVELTDGRGEEGGGGVKSYDGEEAWSSINHSIFSVKGEMRRKADIQKHVHRPRRRRVRNFFYNMVYVVADCTTLS